MIGGLHLLRRHRRHGRGPAWLVGLLVSVVSVLVVLAPAAFTRMVAEEFEQTIESAPPTSRYLVATSGYAPVPAPVDPDVASGLDPALQSTYGALEDQLAEIRRDLPQPLQGTVGPARWSLTTTDMFLSDPRPDSNPRMAGQYIVLRIDPRPEENATLVEGTWPPPGEGSPHENPVSVAISQEAAERVAWKVGEERAGFLLTGIFRAVDPEADYWSLNDRLLEPYIFDDGNRRNDITVTAYADPLRYSDAFEAPELVSTKIWYPLDLGDLEGEDVGDVVAQLRGVTAKTYTSTTSGGVPRLEFGADGLPELEAAEGRAVAARSVLTLAAMGPLGAALVVLVLAVRALATRRRHAVGLLASRGASRRALRTALAVDALVSVVVPVTAAIALGYSLYGAELPVVGVVLATVVGLVPALLLAMTPIEAAMRPTRADSGFRSQSRYRWAWEVLLLVLAAASVYLLVAGGLEAEQGGDVDLLVAAAPLFLAGAACVATLRLYPLPLRAVARWLSRGRSAIGFLGSTRALRDPSVGVAPVLAVLAGVAIAVFSAVTLSTLQGGARDAAFREVGADLRLDGPIVSAEQLARIRDVPGVLAATRIEHKSPRTVAAPNGERDLTEVYAADLDELAAAQASVPGGYDGVATDGVAVSADFADKGDEVFYPEGGATVIATSPSVPGLTEGDRPWMIADASNEDLGMFLPTIVLMGLSEEADREAVQDAVAEITGGSVFADARALEKDLSDDAITTGLRVALSIALALAGLAAAATVVLTLVVGAAARTRMLAILRVLGVTQRQRRWLAVWEQVPVATGALVVGCALGLGLAVMVHAVVDLRPFAGDAGQPPLALQWLEVGGLVGTFVVLMAVAVGIGMLATRRTSAAVAVRLDEE
ncbi:MAG TPA: ABC transporter permease [Nocardioidaceae bacterium]|nr:ABC transporter permease [Nocardioidaceae bacterium]